MMKVNIEKHGFGALMITAFTLLLFSCSKETILSGDESLGEPAIVAVGTRVVNNGDLDEAVTSLRVMTFLGSGDEDRIEYNLLKSELTTDQTLFDLRTGTRTVVFISNETSAMSTALAGVTKLGDLKNITVEWGAFNSTAAIPAYARYNAVTISKNPDSAANISGEGAVFANGKWKIALTRLAAKITGLTLTAESDITATFSGINFGNLPNNVPLVPTVKYNTSGAAQTGAMIPSSGFTITFTSGVWKAVQKATTRIILPSKDFTPVTAESHAVTMSAKMSSGASPTGSIRHTANPLDYTLHRNTEYTLSATVSFPMKVNVTAKQWTPQDIPSTIGRELMISDYDVTLGSDNKYYIYFTSNQRTVTVDPTAIKIYQGNQSTEAVTVAMEPFTAAAGNYGYTYNPVTEQGSGWIKIVSKAAFEYYSFRKININAGGLKRQISILKPGPVFAMSNIVRHSDGTLYFAEDAAALTNNKTGFNLTNVQGLMFRWGSLLGVSGIGRANANWNSNMLVFIPEGHIPPYTVWNSPHPAYLSQNTGNSSETKDDFTYIFGSVGYDAIQGRGDICRYISDKGWVKGRWRIPKGAEMRALYNSAAINLSNNSYRGLRYGAFTEQVTNNIDGMTPILSGYYFGPGVLNAGSTIIADNKIVPFPAVGQRYNTTGKMTLVGRSGIYSTCSKVENGICTLTTFGTLSSISSHANDYGMNVRCVRDLQ